MFQDEQPAQTPHLKAGGHAKAGALVFVKVVPGSRKDEIVGPYGERLKVKVAAPPEDGRANKAVCRLIAGAAGVAERDVTVVAGLTHAEKTLRVAGRSAAELRAALVERE